MAFIAFKQIFLRIFGAIHFTNPNEEKSCFTGVDLNDDCPLFYTAPSAKNRIN